MEQVVQLAKKGASAIAVALVVAGSGCARPGQRLGGGDKVDFCQGYAALDALPQPRLLDRSELLRYADGYLRILGRFDTRRRVLGPDGHHHELPQQVGTSLRDARAALESFREAVRASSRPADLVTAQARLAQRSDYTAADTAMADQFATGCAR